MSFWTNHPFFRITFALILGVIAARFGFSPSENICLWLVLILFIAAFLGKILFKKSSNLIWGNLLLISIFLLGTLRYEQVDLFDSKATSYTQWPQCQAYIGTVTSYPKNKEKYHIYQVDLDLGLTDTIYLKSPARLLLYEKKDSIPSQNLNYGDKILITGSPSLMLNAKNPYEFDFSKYMADQHIHFQHFVSSSQIKLLKKDQGNQLMYAVYRVRSHFEKTIKSQIRGTNEQAIVLALLLGIKDQLDPETKEAYAAAGAMHVLAVSGLHVSIIYFLLTWLFRGLPPGDLKRFLIPTISIATLWLYALLTGFSPSILRAVSMFSIIIFAQILNRRGQIFNSLAFAAFVLLWLDPYYLFNIGFQLSFLAVAGIVYIYPKIYSLWDIDNWVGDYFWKLICVSIAAQVSTFPLSLFYFNQFPTYFLLANLVVIPAAFAVMILGISTLVLSPIITWIAWLLEKVVLFMSWTVRQVELLDGSVIDWIYISEFQTILIYIFIMAFFAMMKYRKATYAWVICIVVVAFSLDRVSSILHQFKAKQLIFYSTTSHVPLIDRIQSFEAGLMSPDSLSDFRKQVNHVAPFRIHRLLPKPQSPQIINMQLSDFAKMEVFEGKKLLFFSQPFNEEEIKFRLRADIVIISNQSIQSLANLDENVDFQEVILDNTNGYNYSNKFEAEAKEMGVNLYNLRNQAHLISLSRNEKLLNLFF
ncbi:MAG: ComEC/Rec2 family competence protein [Reichenbachiella sp.]|uniref:ComEC/Rec2 family competence protein n=1 Tax=Reichenbachiella sp. TaxID=2184521 RepID=UPI002966CB75|nr:ComEC/Rec2 family competence protein [Reichenbachiella sp.]MDW3209275.1 ComEC/Rec2 family competence protein [Reichenbachiella sp.]